MVHGTRSSFLTVREIEATSREQSKSELQKASYTPAPELRPAHRTFAAEGSSTRVIRRDQVS